MGDLGGGRVSHGHHTAEGKPKRRVGTTDLRIAAIALASDLTLVTANTSDFAQVPGLRLEVWTR